MYRGIRNVVLTGNALFQPNFINWNFQNMEKKFVVHICSREKKGLSYSWGAHKTQAGEIKVRKFQEGSEMQEERVQKVITAIFFPQFFPEETSFLRKKKRTFISTYCVPGTVLGVFMLSHLLITILWKKYYCHFPMTEIETQQE